jgi:cytoskeletal protein RodZ
MREISLRDIADRTKISLRYLEAMEDDRFDLLPAPIFAKGFLREYARYVGLSPDEVVNHYLAVQQQQSPDEDGVKKDQALVNRPHRVKPVRSWTYGLFLVLAVLVLIALIWALVWYNNRRRGKPAAEATPPPIAAPAEPVAAQQPLPASAGPDKPSAPLEVTLDFTANCWVEVRVDDKAFLSEERVQGESLPITAQKSVDIKLGDAGAAEIQVNGLAFPLNGRAGEVRELRIDLATVRQLQTKKEAL